MKLLYVIDNQTHRLADILKGLLAEHEGRSLDVATAYFTVGGFGLIFVAGEAHSGKSAVIVYRAGEKCCRFLCRIEVQALEAGQVPAGDVDLHLSRSVIFSISWMSSSGGVRHDTVPARFLRTSFT